MGCESTGVSARKIKECVNGDSVMERVAVGTLFCEAELEVRGSESQNSNVR